MPKNDDTEIEISALRWVPLVARGEARPPFQQALSDQLAAFRDHQPKGIAA